MASALFALGCSGGGTTGQGTGTGGSSASGGSVGTTGAGGTTGIGGNASGGTTGAGGSAGSGASTGSGGTTASGGTTGSGGSTGSGGTTAPGGTTGTAGTGAAGHAAGGTTGVGGSSGAAGHATGGTTGSGGATGSAGTTGSGGSGAAGTGGASANVTVQLGQTEQMIEGFGVNDNWGAQFSSADATALFGTTGSGIGLSLLRVGMSDGGAFYNSFESTNISMAKSSGATKIIGSCWTPPASCKTNNNVNDGGHLCSSTNASGTSCSSSAASTCYDTWSTTIANFAKSNGLYAMSIGNEPDFASCGNTDPCNGDYPTTLYTANELVAWVKVAGPKLQAQGIKVIAPEASEWNHLWSNTSAGPDVSGKNSSDPLKCGFPPSTTGACTTGGGYDYGHYLAKDATAWADFDIIGIHEYDSQVASPWPSDVTAAKKEVWQTEMSGVKWWPEQGPSTDINDGVTVAGWIHSALVTGQASAWFWWWYRAYDTNDNEGLFIQNGGTTNWTDTKRHYTLGNYSKFVRPGYTRVDVTGSAPSGVLLSAYKGSDGTVVVVAINNGTASATVPISISGGTAPASCTPWVTSSSDNLASKTAVTVGGGSFSATLAGATVTTFVCK